MYIFRLAARNLFRQLRRSALSTVSIIAGVAVLILGRGFVSGLKENIIRADIDSIDGHVLARPAGYPTTGVQHPVDVLLPVDPDTAAWLDANTVAWTHRLMFVPRAVKGPDALRVRAFGFDPATDEAVFPRTEWSVDGKIPATAEDGVLVSIGVARILDLHPGGSVILETRTHQGALNALDVPIAGVLTTRNPVLDNLGILVPMPLVETLVHNGQAWSHLVLRLSDRDDATAVAASLQQKLGDAAHVTTWEIETLPLVEAQDMRQKMMDTMVLALMAMAATGIANTVLMAAYERIREIGTLQAMGMTREGVIGMFVAEGFLMGLVGATGGALLGGGAVWWWATHGIDLGPMIEANSKGGGYDSVAFSTMLYLNFSWPTIAVAIAFGVAVAVLASVYPAVLASRLTPADAVRAS